MLSPMLNSSSDAFWLWQTFCPSVLFCGCYSANMSSFGSFLVTQLVSKMRFSLVLQYFHQWLAVSRGGKSTKIFYSSKSTITVIQFYLSKSTSLKIYSIKSKK